MEDKFYDIFESIREQLDIDNLDYGCKSDNTGVEYLKTIVSDKTLLDNDDFYTIPSEITKHSCNVALEIQSVYHSTKDKDKDKDVIYYLQVLLGQCCYSFFVDTRKIDPRLKRKKKANSHVKRKKKSELDSESEE